MSESDGADDPAEFDARLDETAEALETAATEADLDDIEERLDAIGADLEEADLPEPPEPEDEDEEKPPDPREELSARIDEQRDDLADQRGPYAAEIIEAVGSVQSTITGTEWASEGTEELLPPVDSFIESVTTTLDVDIDWSASAEPDELASGLERCQEHIEDAQLDPDADAEAIATLLEAADELADGVDDATAFGDLPVREQLNRQGFFDVLGHYKDFPPEWSALKAHEADRNVEMILLAYDLLDSNFMEEHCIDALRRLGDERAVDPMMGLAQRRNKDAIEVLGKIGSDEPIEMFYDYIETDSDPQLQQVTLKALGEIGSEEATEPVAQQLLAESDPVRSHAARALGMIGDHRAIDPLRDILADDPSAAVRGSAAWALIQIGTRDALDAVLEYAEDQDYLVEAQAAKVTEHA